MLLTGVLPCSLVATTAWAAPAADAIFPNNTVAFVVIPDTQEFEQRWSRTQIGIFSEDPAIQPFINQMRDKAIERFAPMQEQLGVSLDEISAAAGGEVAAGVVYRQAKRAAVVVTIDTTGKDAQAQQLLAKVDGEMARRQAQKALDDRSGTAMTVYTIPAKKAGRKPTTLILFERDEILCLANNMPEAEALNGRIAMQSKSALNSAKAYQETMRRCQAEARGVKPQVRWFIDPFVYDLARRTIRTEKLLPDKKDTITMLREQGFDAIKGIGGHVSLAANELQDVIHRTAIYAPGKPGAKTAAEKYERSMRMAELPNRTDMPMQDWAPRMTATYTTANIDAQNAFDHVSHIFDAMAGYQDAFKTTLEGFEKDPFGPKIKVREEIVAHLGSRVTMMTDYKLPISTDCERYLFVVEVTNPSAMQGPIDRLMENDGAELRKVDGVAYWEIVPENEALAETQIDGGLITIDDTDAEPVAKNDRVLRRAAVCLQGNQLIVASDSEFLRQVLSGVDDQESLAESFDYRVTMVELNKVASQERCSWSFFRTDESVRPTYELIREGKMPEAQTFFGRGLNRLMTTAEEEEEGIVRKQRLDGSSLPSFELARRYFGPAGRSIRSDDDGWFISGVILSKAAQGAEVATINSPANRAKNL